MPLDRIPFETTNRPIHTFAHDRGLQLNFDAPYQRAEVWVDADRVLLIKSLMQGLPVGVIFINHRDWKSDAFVVDGKQRLTSILRFLADGFAVPARWFADEDTEASEYPALHAEHRHLLDSDIVFSQLTANGQGRLLRNAIAFYETNLPTEVQERDLFNRINFGGQRHNETDRA